MRLWSLHPQYLDAKGLVALWREGLLALHVLRGKTKGYTRHPQLDRFRSSNRPLAALSCYLSVVLEEAVSRGYRFDASKIRRTSSRVFMTVTQGQLDYEWEHLQKKLSRRDLKRYQEMKNLKHITPHPVFKVVEGERENWEKVE